MQSANWPGAEAEPVFVIGTEVGMPVYEYKCSRCDCRFELRQSINDTNGARCPDCGQEAHRLFIPVPIIFKGSGFYVTDSRPGLKSGDKETKALKEPAKPSTLPAPSSTPAISGSSS